MNEPLVSVIMPVYNAERYLREAVVSVLAQTYMHWELWMINDAGSDNSAAIMEELAQSDQRIHALHLSQNSGSAIARNSGIKQANGKYIAFLDADDKWLPTKLEKQVHFMETHRHAFSFTWYQTFEDDGRNIIKNIKAPAKVTYHALLKNNTIGCLTAMYNCEMLGKQFMPDIRKRQDYGLWLNILRSGTIAHCLPEYLALYRTGTASLSHQKSGVLKYNWELLRRHQHLSFPLSVYYFTCFVLNKSAKYLKG